MKWCFYHQMILAGFDINLYNFYISTIRGKIMPKRFKLVGCKVLMRELYQLAYQSENIIDIRWKKQALHNTPDLLRQEVQATIDSVEAEDEPYDAILLGYGLCSNGIVGLQSRKIPLVIPRGHDCITFLLGSKEKYRDIFNSYSGGIYWYSPGWIEHSMQPGKLRYDTVYQQYVEKYGEDNAQYLMDMEQGWMKEYKCAFYIDWPEQHRSDYADFTRDCADYLHWEYRSEIGSNELLKDLLAGNWDPQKFLVVQPGETVKPSYDADVIRT
jgi:hypothetical protein